MKEYLWVQLAKTSEFFEPHDYFVVYLWWESKNMTKCYWDFSSPLKLTARGYSKETIVNIDTRFGTPRNPMPSNMWSNSISETR